MLKVSLFLRDNDKSKPIKEELLKELKARKDAFEIDEKNPDVVIVLGGDGSLLGAIHAYIDKLEDVSFVGINTGTLGFLMEFKPTEIKECLDLLEDHARMKINTFKLLKCEVKYDDEHSDEYYAVNEFKLSRHIRSMDVDVYINDDYLEFYRGAGLLFASTIGSTALALSYGGPILSQDTELVELLPIAPIVNREYKPLGTPLIMKSENNVRLIHNVNNIRVGYDAFEFDIDHAKEIILSLSNKQFYLITNDKRDYIARLKEGFLKND